MSYNLNFVDTIDVVKNMRLMIVAVNDNGTIVALSQQAQCILECEEHEVVGKDIRHLFSTDVNCIINTERSRISNVLFKTKNGQLIYFTLERLFIDNKKNIKILHMTKQTPQELFNAIALNCGDSGIYDDSDGEIISYIKDLNGNIVFANRRFENFFNTKKSEIIGKNIKSLYKYENGDTYLRWSREDDYVIKTNESVVTFDSLILEDKVKYLKIKKKPVHNKYENIVGLYCTIKDVTNEIMLKNDLMLKNEQLSIINEIMKVTCKSEFYDMFDNLLEILNAMCKISWITVYVFDDCTKQLEYFASKGVSKKYFNEYIQTRKNIKFIEKIFDSVSKNTNASGYYYDSVNDVNHYNIDGTRYIKSYQMVDKNKTIGLINFGSRNEDCHEINNSNFLELISNSIARIVNNIITKMELKLRLKNEIINNQKMDMFFNTSLDLLCIISFDGKIVRVGNQMLNDLGYVKSEIIDKSSTELIHPDDKSVLSEVLFQNYQLKDLCLRMRKSNGEYINITWNINYLEEEKLFICSGRNLTNEIILEQKKNIFENYIKIEKAKTEFLSNIEHELRTPIAIIDGSLNLISNIIGEDKSDKKIKNYLNSAIKNTYRLKRLINNVIEITSYDANSIKPDKNYYNIIKILSDLVISLKQYLHFSDVNLEFDSEIDKYILFLDPYMIERVLLNLVSNSVKYKKENINPDIKIRAFIEDKKFKIGVLDNGIGLTKEEIPFIFEKFSQLSDVMTKNAEGSGMGLYLVKILLKINNAGIYVNDERTDGTEFIIEFYDKPYDEKLCNDCNNYNVIQEHFDLEFSDIYL